MFGSIHVRDLLQQTDHRPWPVPEQPWILSQVWHDLLFAHWPVEVGELLPLIPDMLDLDSYQGKAWLGVIPFWMSAVKPRWCPAMPWLSLFPELNVRTYVKHEKKPGVYFFSLDAGNPVAVSAARRFFCLPYFRARMQCLVQDGTIDYANRRIHPGEPNVEFLGSYRGTGAPARSMPGTLDYWLTERYCLYTQDERGVLYRCNIHHLPWLLQPAEAHIETNTMSQPLDIELNGNPVLHYANQMEVLVWPLEAISKPVPVKVLAENPV